MKNIYKFLFTTCLVFAVANIQAQIKFGPTAGLNLSTMTIKVLGINFDSETIQGFHAGVVSEIPLNESFFVQPAVLYSVKGADYSFLGEKVSLRPSFIEVPVNIVFKYDVGFADLLLKAGPYLAYGVGGYIESNGVKLDIDYGTDASDMKAFDSGISFGAGLDINNFLITGQYNIGLANLTPIETGNAEMKINVLSFSVAYLFGL